MVRNQKWAVAAALAALLAACGGGGDTTPRITVSSVQVIGDSLQDVGTFGGVRATVQGSDSVMYVERVGLAYGMGRGCNFYVATGASTFAANPMAGCKNYAIGGGVINGASGGLASTDPRIVGVQIAKSTEAGNFTANDLLVVDGGGNDAAALVGAYLKAAGANGDGGVAYVGLLSTQLSQAQVGAAVAGGQSTLATAGAQYMAALAGTFYNQIKTGLLDKGGPRVVLLNIPAITNTPRFQMVLDSIAAASGGGATGAAARAQSEALFRSWVAAFNSAMATAVAGNARVLLVDLAKAFDDQVAAPAQFGLTNVKTPACPVTGVGADGLPTYNFATCTADSLSAMTPPSGATGGANWWKTYYFSDGFHPTPYGHLLAYQLLIAKALTGAGWL